MSTFFISDLHLDDDRPDMTALFRRFLKETARSAHALYILGDLFEAWVGDDDDTPLVAELRADLSAAARELPIYFMPGNRDFLVGEHFAAATGLQLLDDPARVELYGTPTLLMHGDTLCTDDHEYQRWRSMVRDPGWQERFLKLPLDERRRVAREVRGISRSRTARKPDIIMDVNPGAVADAFRKHDVRRLIHGHTHRMDVHTHHVDGRRCQRIVLGDWYTEGNALRVSESGYRLYSLPPETGQPAS